MRSLGQKTRDKILKRLREKYDFSLCPLAQLLTDVYPGISEWCKNFTRKRRY